MSVWIRPRTVKVSPRNPKGRTFQVCYRMPGGRGVDEGVAGTFKTLREANLRRDVIAGEIAAGRHPRAFLESLMVPRAPIVRRTVEQAFDEWLDGLIDLGEKSVKTYRSHRSRIVTTFGKRYPLEITSGEVQAWIRLLFEGSEDTKPMKPKSIESYVITLRQVLDHERVSPNPARREALRLPKIVKEQVTPMSYEQFHQLLAATRKPEHRLLMRILEATGIRVGEVLKLTWGNVDWACWYKTQEHEERAYGQLLLPAHIVKGKKRAHFAQVPGPLMEELRALVPPDDRAPERRIFPIADQTIRDQMRRACISAGLPHFHPHDFRHRRISLWHAQGVPAVTIQYRVGHTNLEEQMNTYTHMIIDTQDDWA